MEGFAAVDLAAVSMEYQAPLVQVAGLGGGWDADPAAAGKVIGESPVQDVQEVIPVDVGVPVDNGVPVDAGAGGGRDAGPQQPAVDDGGWGNASGATAGGGW